MSNPPLPQPQSVAGVDPRFEACMTTAAESSAAESTARQIGAQVAWCRPDVWNGNPFDLENMAAGFDSSQAEAFYLAAVADAQTPGTTGDVVATTTSIDYLATMERAFRARFMRRPRATMLAMGRKLGHGSPFGAFMQNGLAYMTAILTQAKIPQ